MADKTYKMLVTLSNGSTIDAGTFVAPQGPKGDTGTIPEALPQETSALKRGNLPTTGWTAEVPNIATTTAQIQYQSDTTVTYIDEDIAKLKTGWAITLTGDKQEYIGTYYYQYQSGQNQIVFDIGMTTGNAYYLNDSNGYKRFRLTIYYSGEVQMSATNVNTAGTYGISIKNTTNSQWSYTISDTSITANSDVLMELTDEGGVKSYAMEADKVTVIRDTVPTQPIPYTYKVKQTNASGQFTVLNHFVPNVPTVPTKTSELTNDSGFVTNLPIVRNVVCNDVGSATTLDTTITCEVGDLILAQIIVRSALTLPTGWTLLRTIPAIETTYNQTLSFAYKRATSTSETLTVTQTTAGRIYTNLVRLSNAKSISYIQSCEKTGTDITSISSTKPVTPNMVIWGASSTLWTTTTPYGDWTSSPSTLDYYSVPQATKQPRLGTFIDSSGTGERTFSTSRMKSNNNAMMCGAVEIVGDEVARKGDIPTKTSQLTNDSGFVKASEANTFTGVQTFSNADGIKTDRVHNLDNNDAWYNFDGSNNRFGSPSRPTIIRTSEARPRAQVPSGETTVTKEIALLEDVQGSEWAVNNDNSVFPKNGWYLISSMVVGSYQLAPFIALVTSQNNKLVVVTQDLEGHDVTLAMTIGSDRKFADAIRVHTYTIANNAVTATSASLSITTLLTDGQFSFDYKLLY